MANREDFADSPSNGDGARYITLAIRSSNGDGARYLTLAIRLHNQIVDKQCNYQTERPPVFEENSYIFCCSENIALSKFSDKSVRLVCLAKLTIY